MNSSYHVYYVIIFKQQRQYTGHLTRGSVRGNILAVEKQYDAKWVCVCSLRYPTCSSHARHCHLSPVHLDDNFPHYFIKDAFKKKLLNM